MNATAAGQTIQATTPTPAATSAPRLPASIPYHPPATAIGSVAPCRSQPPPLTPARRSQVVREARASATCRQAAASRWGPMGSESKVSPRRSATGNGRLAAAVSR